MSTEVVNQIVDQMQAPPPSEAPQAAEVLDNKESPTLKETKAPQRDEKISGRLEVLIRREQAALNRERAADGKLKELEAKLKRIEEFEGAKGNSKKALELLGLDYSQLTESLMKDGEIPPEVRIKEIESKFDAFKDEKQKEKEAQELRAKEYQEAQTQRVIENFKGEITTYLSDNKTRYELIEFEGEQDLVFQVIDEHYNRTLNPDTGVGKVMSIAEAADKVEEHLEKKYNDSKKLSKVQTLWSAVPRGTLADAVKAETKRPSQKPQTLTNQMASHSTPQRKTVLTDDERIQKAIAYAKGLRPG